MDLKWSISIKEEFMKLKKLMSIILAPEPQAALPPAAQVLKRRIHREHRQVRSPRKQGKKKPVSY